MPYIDIDDKTQNWLTQIAVAEGLEGLRLWAEGQTLPAYIQSRFVRLADHTDLRECECGTTMDGDDPSFGSVQGDGEPVCLSCGARVIVDNDCLDSSLLVRDQKSRCVGIIDIVHSVNYEHPKHPLHEAYGILTLMVMDWMRGWRASPQGGRETHRQKRGKTPKEPL